MVETLSFFEALAAYRSKAAKRHAELKRIKIAMSALSGTTTKTLPSESYRRRLFPALECYLRQAANAYRRIKGRSPPPSSLGQKRFAFPLGRGELVTTLAADVRHAKWVLAKAVEQHRRRGVRHFCRDIVVASGIPLDIRQTALKRYLERNTRIQGALTIAEKVGCMDEELEAKRVECRGIRCDSNGFAQHVSRCQEGFRAGISKLHAHGTTKKVNLDTFDEVKRRYAGRPDEVYRRKTARKFATFRRQRRQMEEEESKRTMSAETEMRRRRGHDYLLTSREVGDSSFAPFLYELDSKAYAYSSKITEAPKLRKVMMNKYLARNDAAGEPNAVEKARLAAESNRLFHTRVMNRFT